ncbi:hypothetical protein CP980_34745 [Streptomyces vinaceus]|uniref:Uncharacterized protein n=1 Tax=Streptomyces vinaceus TaxID=1960 RepID=A0A5J6JF12_STRVI|nr:hypothetical protein [Streptomyces vinaceus]QEV49500.1 hypothetical protein CP980_34745 [Streptomyces vinaceus]GHE46177.1 hypothetical protein GCM10017778_32540 [Streptomyces vinaceus]
MKALAVHDAGGNILHLVLSPEDGPAFGVESRAGQYMHTVEISDISLDMPDREIYQRLNEVATNFRVEVAEPVDVSPAAQLVTKNSSTES